MRTRKDALQACSIVALSLGTTVTTQAHAIAATPMAIAVNADHQPAIAAQSLVFETSVSPQSDEDLAAVCPVRNHPDERLADCPGSLGHLRA